MTEFKWQIDTIRTVLFSNEKFKFKKKEWSKIVTGLDISNEMTQEENGITTQYVEITNLDHNRQFNLVHIKEQNVQVGISIKLNTPVDAINDYLALLDVDLVMSVEPGFGGQSFKEIALDKI